MRGDPAGSLVLEVAVKIRAPSHRANYDEL